MVVESMSRQLINEFQLPMQVVDNSMNKNNNEMKQSEIMEIDFSQIIDVNLLSMKEPLENCQFCDNIFNISMHGCNLSHELQNEVCCYTRVQHCKDVANSIINNAGQMENHWRNIEAQCRQCKEQSLNHHDKDQLLVNLNKTVLNQLDAVNKNLGNIEQHEKNTLFKSENIENLASTVQILIATVRDNMKLQTGM